jgi:hypothetical protein
MESTFAYVGPQLLFALPPLVALLVGLVLLAGRRNRLTPGSRRFGMAGCAVLLVGSLVDAVRVVLFPQLIANQSAASIELLFAGIGIVQVLLYCVGLGLMIAAILAGSAPATAPGPAPWYPRPPGGNPPP